MGSGGTASGKKKKYAIIGFSSLLLVAMVIGVAVTATKGGSNSDDKGRISSTSKAVQAVCSPTDFKDACVKSLSSANSSDPRKLVKAAFQAAITSIDDGVKEATEKLKSKAGGDKRTEEAIDLCGDLMDRAVDDLKKSISKIQQFSFSGFEDLVQDLRVWLSGAMTYQQTCVDGFQGVNSEAGKKIERIFKTANQLTNNGLAIATDLWNLLKSFHIDIPGLTGSSGEGSDAKEATSSRRLLSVGEEFPSWVGANSRRLLAVAAPNIKADAVVALDGSGQFRTIRDALNMVPKNNMRPFVVYIKEGLYNEQVEVGKHMTNVMFIGDGPTKTRITGKLSFSGGVNTYRTATVAVNGDWFMAKDIGIENTAGPEGHQAVALRVSGDYAVLYNCQFDGYQDTLYAHTHRQFYRDCVISGTVDFVFGDAQALFQNCKFVVRRPGPNQQCIVTAQGRINKREPTGIVIHKSHITGEPAYLPVKTVNKAYLGRPWKQFSRTIIMQTLIDDIIDPEGWLKWNDTFAFDTLYYSEYLNTGPGARQDLRVKWSGIKLLSPKQAKRFTAARFLRGNRWIPRTGVPYTANMD